MLPPLLCVLCVLRVNLYSPTDNTVQVFTLDGRDRYGAPTIYTVADQAPVGVLPGLIVDLSRVFTER